MHAANELMMPLQDVLRALPGVYPIKLASHLRMLFTGAQGFGLTLSSPLSLSKDDVLAMFSSDKDTRHLRVTPYGVKKLVELYEQETLPLRPGVMELRPAPELLRYITSENDQVDKTLQKMQQFESALRLLPDPANITEDDFSFDLLHAIFEKYATQSTSVLLIGNRQVTRYISRIAQNGRKARGATVTFRWTSGNGESRELSR